MKLIYGLLILLSLQLSGSELVLLSPVRGESVSLLRPDWKELVEQRKMIKPKKKVLDQNLHFPLPVKLAWKGGTPPYELHLSGGSDHRTINGLSTGKLSLVNLLSGTRYEWSITDAAGNHASSVFHTQAGPRLIELPDKGRSPVNLRDLGGRTSKYGGVVRQGIIYRGSELNYNGKFSEKNRLFMVRELKIRTELDLRYENQIKKEKQTFSTLGRTVVWHHYAVNAYESFTPEQNVLFRNAIRVFASKDAYPVFIHCNGGVDRTGEVSFLLNAVAGVSDAELLEDYEFSSLSIFPRPRTIPYFQRWLKGIASYSSADKSYSEQVEQYLLGIGVTREEIAAIRANMLQTEPEESRKE